MKSPSPGESRSPDLSDILLLLTVQGIGNWRARILFTEFGSIAGILKAPKSHLTALEGIEPYVVGRIRKQLQPSVAAGQLEALQRTRTRYVTIWDAHYPELLRTAVDAPIVLFYRGSLPSEWPLCIGVVGTRQPTAYGRAATEVLVAGLAVRGIGVVSGLARGIDTIAHAAALRCGGRTFAVMGTSVESVYPSENRLLAHNLQVDGALISEFLPGTGPDAVNFPRRNRIISGLSMGTVVIEAGARSGALITAQYALDQNRDVFAIPGPIHSGKSIGPNRLLQQGAIMVTSVNDILGEIRAHLPANKERIETTPNLSSQEKRIWQNLDDTAQHVDDLARQTGFSLGETLNILLTLEIQHLVEQLPGMRFQRRNL